MRRRGLVLLALVLVLAGCRQEPETTGSICPARAVASYNARDLDQCVSACRSCDRGTTTTCTTSCRLKGAS